MEVKSRSVKRNAKNGRGLRRDMAVTAPFPKSRASYFCFARFNTSPLYYLRAWHKLQPWSKRLGTLEEIRQKDALS